MISSEYRIVETLHENSAIVVYRAVPVHSSKSVIVKMLKPGQMSAHRIAQMMNEQQILARFSLEQVPKLIRFIATPSEYIHVFEDIGGTSLYELLTRGRFEIREALEIALQIAKTLALLHRKHVIHADINPKNIIYNPHSRALQIIDFGYSILEHRYTYGVDNGSGASGNIMYMSPEQTGRTGTMIDQRSDLYSMGMTLYHLFAARLPFEARDRFDLIHKQIVLQPEPLEGVPEVLGDIVFKLIAKAPDDRYQSDEALLEDLERVVRTMTPEGTVERFEIALMDRPRINFGRQLFAREKEKAHLHEVMRCIEEREPAGLLLYGNAGVGKSRLAEELFAKMPQLNILRIKFEQYKATQPYAALRQVFEPLKLLLLRHAKGKSTVRLEPRSAAALCALFPELSELFDASVQVNGVSGDEAAQLIPYAFGQLWAQAALLASPLMLFVDDLQWADVATVSLLRQSVLYASVRGAYLMMAWRDDRLEECADALKLVQEAAQLDSMRMVHIAPLTHDEVSKMIPSLLGGYIERPELLSSVIHRKSEGYPFYINALLKEMIDAKVLWYEAGGWHFDTAHIRLFEAETSMADLLQARFARLSAAKRRALAYLGLLGSRFERILTVGALAEAGIAEVILEELELEGLIELDDIGYRFAHDLLHKLAVECIETQERMKIHRALGRYLHRAYRRGVYEDVVGVVAHLNAGYEAGAGCKERCALTLKALETMVQSGSYSAALDLIDWIETHRDGEQMWHRKRGTAFRYGILKAKVFYLSAMHVEADAQIVELIVHARTLSERLSCLTLYKNLCVTRGRGFEGLIAYGDELLEALGMHRPKERSALEREVAEYQVQIAGSHAARETKSLLALPQMKRRDTLRVVAVLVEYWEAAYYLADIPLMRWAYLSIVVQALHHGNSPHTAFGYVLYGAQLVDEGRYKEGYRFGETAIRLNREYDDEVTLPKVYNFMANFIKPYVHGFEKNLPLYRKSLKQSEINGDIVFGAWANFLIHLSDYFSGRSLERLRERVERESTMLLRSGDQKMMLVFDLLRAQLHVRLRTPFDEGSALALWERERFYPALTWYGILKAQQCWLEGNNEEGLAYLERYVRSEENAVIMFPKIRLHAIRPLLLLGLEEALSPARQEQLERDLQFCEAIASSAVFEHRFWHQLLQAKRIRRIGNHWDVAKKFDAVLSQAKKANLPFFIAIAAVCSAHFWEKRGVRDLSRFYYSEAVVGLNQWGDYTLAHTLSTVDKEEAQPRLSAMQSSSSSLLRSDPGNYRILMRSFYALSQTTEKKRLLQTLMRAILENATASRAVLVFREGERFYESASMYFEDERIEMHATVLHESALVPYLLVRRAISTRRKVIIEHPYKHEIFAQDDYYRTHTPALSIAIPALVEGEVMGVLYLENSEIATALHVETLQTLRLLLTQAAIVYQNAILYDTLRESEQMLNKAQQIAHVGGWGFDAKTQEVRWSAETYRIYDLEPFSREITPEWIMSRVHPDDREIIAASHEKILAGDPDCDVISRIVTEEGTVKVVHQRAEVVWVDGYQKLTGTIQDITATRRAEEMIDRLSQVVRQTPFSIIITDSEGLIEYVNDAALALSGYFRHEMIGQSMSLFSSGYHPKPFYDALWDTIKHKRTIWRGTIVNRMKEGAMRDCASTIFPVINTHGELAAFVTIQDDVTERNMKDKLFLMQTRQAQMGEMLSMIAHQWRQPLAIMSALLSRQKVNIMLENASFEEIGASLDEIETQIQHLSRTITDFRDFFRPDKQMVQTTSSVLVDKTIELVEHVLMNKNIKVIRQHLNDNPYHTYESEMIQVLLNLVKNAQDAFDERAIEEPRLNIQTDQTGRDVVIVVEDNAGGIAGNILDNLFAPYATTKPEGFGTGLGLYMSKTIVQDHCGGTIEVENSAKGARFTIRFPIRA